MKKVNRLPVLLMLLLAVAVVCAGCCSSSGSREFIPGKGWVPND